MNEKNIELSNDNNFQQNFESGFSFTQSQQYQPINQNIEGEGLFNFSENEASNIKSHRPTMIKKHKNNNTIEKKIEYNFILRNIKKIKEGFKSLITYINFLTGKSIKLQVGITYSIFLSFLIVIVVILMLSHIKNSINNLADKKYFLFYVNNIIDTQREIKVQLDEINNQDIMASINEPLLFYRIYTEEMVENKILMNDTIKVEQNLRNIYEQNGDNYILSKDLYQLVEMNNNKQYENINDTENNNYNINNLIPFYYHYSPILIEHLNNCGIKLNNFYFIAQVNIPENNEKIINSMYFKYPLEKTEIAPDVLQYNDKIYDFILDPFVKLYQDFDGQEDIINEIESNNWFSQCYKDEKNNYRLLKINKLSEEKIKEDYLIIYSRTQNMHYLNNDQDSPQIYFTISVKINQDKYKYNNLFIKLNENNDILNFDYLSLYNFKDEFSPTKTTKNHIKQKFEIDYDLDNGNNILIRIPRFIYNIHAYSMEEKNIEGNEKEQSKLLKYHEMKDIKNFYDINYYFKKDSLIFYIIYFLNEFFKFKKNHFDYLSENETLNESINDHPCTFLENPDEYYNLILQTYNYDCLDDFCLYNNCDKSSSNLEDLYYMPNCYCIPLYCRDSLSMNSEFHKKLKNRIKYINSSFSDNAYTFTSSYEDYLIKKQYEFSKIDNYFNRNNFVFKCKLDLVQKNYSYNNFFNVKIKIQNMTYKEGDETFLMFFMNNNMTSFLVNNFKNTICNYFRIIFSGYVILFICTLFILLKYILVKVNNLLERMEIIKKIRKSLILNDEENNSIEKKTNSNHSMSIESVKNLGEDILSIKKIENTRKNKLIKKGKNGSNIDIKKVVEFDELDALIQLINENLADFQIKFNLNEDMNSDINEIKKQYNGIIKINQYKNKLLANKDNEINNSFDDEEETITESIEKEENFDDLSLKMFYELLSTSTSEMDFSNIKRNFYYRKHDGKLLFGLDEILPCFNDEDSNGNGEITNLTKIQNSINYYYSNIHNYWEQQYENMKREESKF